MALAASTFGTVYLVVQSEGTINRSQWDDWIAMLERGRHQPIRLIVESHGGAPNTLQRKQFIELFRQVDLRAAVMTDNAAARGVATALAWLGLSLRAFPLGRLAEVSAYLELTPDEHERSEQELIRLRAACRSEVGNGPQIR